MATYTPKMLLALALALALALTGPRAVGAFGPGNSCEYHCFGCYDSGFCYIPRPNGIQPPGKCFCSGYPETEVGCENLLCKKKPEKCCRGVAAGANRTAAPSAAAAARAAAARAAAARGARAGDNATQGRGQRTSP